MKKILTTLLATMLFALAWADELPFQRVKIISSFPVGSGPDAFTRNLVEVLSEQWKRPVVVENKPGANGIVAAEAFVVETNAKQSDLIVYLTSVDLLFAYSIINQTEKYNQIFRPLVPALKTDMVLISGPGIKNWDSLIKKVQDNPSYGSWGIGSGGHIAALQFLELLNKPGVHAPYRDFNQWFVDVSSEQLPFSFITIASSRKLEQAGKLKYMAVTSDRRHPDYPNVPTMAELTGKKIGWSLWTSFYVSRNMPDSLAERLNKDFTEAMKSAKITDTYAALNYRPWLLNLREVEDALNKDRQLWSNAFKKYNIKFE